MTEIGKQELGPAFNEMIEEMTPGPPPAQSYSYINMNMGPRPNRTSTTTTTTMRTTEPSRGTSKRPEFVEVHRTPFFKGLNLDNPFKNEFEHDFEMTKNTNFPSFATQLDYDYNPYEAPPVPPKPRSVPVTPVKVPVTPVKVPEPQQFNVPELESFSEEDILIPDMPPPGPAPPAEFLVKMPPPANPEPNFYRTNYQQSPYQQQRPQPLPTAATFANDAPSVRQLPRSLTSFFDAGDAPKVLPTTAYVFANERDELFKPDFENIPREPFAPPPELLEAAKRKRLAGELLLFFASSLFYPLSSCRTFLASHFRTD